MITLGLIYTLIILILLAFAIYEHIHAQSLSLPISPGLTLLTILLPLLSAFNTVYLYRISTTNTNQNIRPKLLMSHSSSTITPNPSNPNQQLQIRPSRARRPHPGVGGGPKPSLRSLLPSLSSALQTTQLIFSVILVTLATSSLTSSPFSIPSVPGSGSGSGGQGSIELCALEQTWSHFFRTHDADSIRKIQDALQCCGFRNPKHMSWPFPSGRNGQPGGPGQPGKGTEQCMNMWPDRKEGCANKWEGGFRSVMGGEVAVVVGVLAVQVFGWGLGRYFQARQTKGAARRGGSGRNENVVVNGDGEGSSNGGNGGNANNGSWWNKLLQSFGVPHGDENDTQAQAYRGLEDGELGAQRRPLLGEGHFGIEEVDDESQDGDGGEERDVERGGSAHGYGSATNSRVQPSGIHQDVADPWADGN